MRDLAERALGANHVWVSLFLGVCMQLCAGTLYSVTAWGVTLKEVAGWNSDESLGVAETVGTMGINIAFHNGFLVDRLGSRPMSAVAALALFSGWHLLANVASSGGSPSAAALALWLVGQGSITAFMCSLDANVGNFSEENQGKAHGLLLSGFGGSAALFATVYRSHFAGVPTALPSFFRGAGYVTAVVCIAGALLLKDARHGDKSKARRVVREEGEEGEGPELVGSRERSDGIEMSTMSKDGGMSRAQMESFANFHATTHGTDDGEDETTWQYLRGVAGRPLYWVIFVIVACTIGTALLWVNEAGSFTHVLTGSRKGLSNMVVAFSLGNVFGRLGAGWASDVVELSFGAPRSVFLTFGGGLFSVSMAALAGSERTSSSSRMFSAIGVGLAEGTVMSTWTAIVRRSFGAERFGLNLAVYNFAMAIGSGILNGLAAAATETEDEQKEINNLRLVFWVAAVCNALAAVIGIVATRILREENARMGYQMTIV